MTTPRRCLWALDNVEGLSRLTRGSVALAYLDPPFNSGRTYAAVLSTTRTAGTEIRPAFADNWRWNDDTESTLRKLGCFLSTTAVELVRSLTRTLGPTPIAAYLVAMAPRLAQCHRALKRDGSLYVHCDPAASHYLKILLDHIFGVDNFRNEVIWKRTHAHSSSRRYGPVHDTLLFYSKSSDYIWNPVFSPYQASYLEKHFRQSDDQGCYQLITCTAPGDRPGTRAHYKWKGLLPPPGRHWAWKEEQMELFEREGRLVHSSTGVPRLKRYSHEGAGVPVQDVWLDINRLDSHSRERIGFDTQKPLALLHRIITASSNPGDLVLDPFAGSGTTAVAAERLQRRWVAIDSSLMACAIALARVRQEVNLASVHLDGFPTDTVGARRLLREEPAAFGIWGTSMLGSIPDRAGTNQTVVVGAGNILARSRRIEILSWVPISARLEMAVPATARGRLSKLGVILRHNRSATTAQHWLTRRLNIPTHVVNLDNLVDAAAHKTGLSSGLATLLRRAS